MSERTITAVLRHPVQTGPDHWEMKSISRNFSGSRSIDDILAWAKSEGVENPSINDVILCAFTGESC